jgi:hypothetical protein
MACCYEVSMREHPETTTYHIRATDPTSGEQVAYECVGYATAHAKAAELRMAAYKDVVLSIPNANDNGPAV